MLSSAHWVLRTINVRSSMKVLILGATGKIGVLAVAEALKVGHHVVIYARSPQKLSEDILFNPHVQIIKGELTDEEALSKALDGVDAVISTLGPSYNQPAGNPLAHAYALLIKAMLSRRVDRLVALGTASNVETNDKPSLSFWTIIKSVSLFARTAYSDIVAIGEEVRDNVKHPDLRWTLARVPILTNTDSTAYHVGYIGDGKTQPWLSRKAYAVFIVAEVSANDWVCESPFLSSGHD